MTRLVSLLSVAAAVLWSLLAWAGYALVSWFGDLAATNADWLTGDPETVAFLSWLAGLLKGFGLAGVLAVWGVGVALLLLLPAAARLAVGTLRATTGSRS